MNRGHSFNMSENKSITDLIIEYFKKHPKKELPHAPVVDWVEEQYMKLYNKKPRDTGGLFENCTKKVF